MGYTSLHSASQLLLVPRLPALRWDIRGQHINPNPFSRQESLQPLGDVVLESEYRKDLAAASLAQLEFNFLNEAPLLRIRNLGIQVRRARYQDALPFLGLRVVPEGREVPETERFVRIKQQGVHAHAQNRLIAAVRF